MIQYDALIKSLAGAVDYAPVYLLCGDESYYIDLACQYMEQNILTDPMAREMDQMVVYGKDLPGDDIAPAIGQARGFAMTGGKKVIIIKEAQSIRKWEALALYMQNPQPNSVLIICYKYGTPDKKLKLWKHFEEYKGVWMQSDAIKDYALPRWIQTYLDTIIRDRHLTLTVEPVVPQLLAEYIGSELDRLVKSIDQLLLGMPEGQKRIDAALVERNLGISKDYNVFELQNALKEGNALKAYRITHHFATSKTHPMIKELGVLYTFFSNLMLYHYLPDKTERVAAPILGVSPFFVKDYALAAKRYSAGKTFRIIGYFRDIDARLKGINNPSTSEEDLWKELIYKILH